MVVTTALSTTTPVTGLPGPKPGLGDTHYPPQAGQRLNSAMHFLHSNLPYYNALKRHFQYGKMCVCVCVPLHLTAVVANDGSLRQCSAVLQTNTARLIINTAAVLCLLSASACLNN